MTEKFFNRIDRDKYFYDKASADRAIKFIMAFTTHVKGKLAGKPYILQEWEKNLIGAVFGWKEKETGLRKYREVFVFLPRKNSKSTLSSAISLYMLLADGEKGQELVVAASSRSQAGFCYDIIKGMVNNSKELSKHLKVFRNSIELEKSNSYLKCISAESSGIHGANINFAIVDELHAHYDASLYDVIKTSMGAREQPLLLSITTAGTNKNHICYDLYEYSKKLIEGVIEDETFLPWVYEGEDSNDLQEVLSIDNFKKANPSFGLSIKEDYLKEQIQKAKNMPSYLNTVKQLHLNIWVDSATAWINNSDWMQNSFDYDEEDLLGEECYAGLDLANNLDLNAFVLLFPQSNGKFKTLAYSFLPYESAERKDNISAGKAFIGWSKNNKNKLFLTDKRSRDDDFIFNKILELAEKFRILNIAYDRWGADQLVTKLEVEGLKFTSFGQGYKSMSPATKKAEALILDGNLLHNNNPILKWCISNVKIVKDDADNIKPSKARSKEKIDCAVALIMAIGQYFLDVENDLIEANSNKSPYSESGFFFV
ncbi:terminase large subunit [Litoribacter alkaliphilus]|uniref:Terminase large subunit n=1 Tax=Litoribacter ruber TaxID=702568 RepID=A0AAP2G6P5_9BACT|nr:terminase TerL endonuclease subunit [Litoribacter alkaliphilus]MBS9525923.1 terminase large subunit [Litoribacter alkaliphilus]